MISISTVINTFIAFGGLRVAEEAVKQSIKVIKQKIGDKKYNQVVIQGRKIVADLNQIAKDLGVDDDIENVKNLAVHKLCFVAGIDEEQANEIIVKITKSIESMVDESVDAPTEQPQQLVEQIANQVPTQPAQ